MLTAINQSATQATAKQLETQLASDNLCVHLITLIHRATGKEESFEIQTATERFSDVMREITHQKFMRNLKGYEFFEALPLQCPLPF